LKIIRLVDLKSTGLDYESIKNIRKWMLYNCSITGFWGGSRMRAYANRAEFTIAMIQAGWEAWNEHYWRER